MTNIINCRSGWKNLYQPIVDDVINFDKNQRIASNKIGIKRVTNIEGKLYVLLVNPENATKSLIDKISKAQSESEFTCEFCGKKSGDDSNEIDNVGYAFSKDEKIICCKKCYNTYLLTKERTSRWFNFL